MKPQYGAEVIDKNGEQLGIINYLVRDTWSGEIRKFMAHRKVPDKDLVLSSEDASKVTESTVELNLTFEELNQR